jgi:hypothetical protein
MNVTTSKNGKSHWLWILIGFLLGLSVAFFFRGWPLFGNLIRFNIDPDSGVVYLAPRKNDVIIWNAVGPGGYKQEYAHIRFPPKNSPCKETEDGGHKCTVTGDKGYFHYFCSATPISSDVTCIDPGVDPNSSTDPSFDFKSFLGLDSSITILRTTVNASERETAQSQLLRNAASGTLVQPLQLTIACDNNNNAIVEPAIPGELMKAVRGQIIQWNGGRYGYTINNLDPNQCKQKTGLHGEVSCKVNVSLPNSSTSSPTSIGFRVTTTTSTGKQACSGTPYKDSSIQVDNMMSAN